MGFKFLKPIHISNRMIKIKEFRATDIEFKEIASISNVVNHNYITHYRDDKDNWSMRDRDRLHKLILLYSDVIMIGYINFEQGIKQNQRTIFFNIKLDPNYNYNGYRYILYKRMLKEIKSIQCNKLFTEVYEHLNYKNYQNLLINNKFELVQKNREYSCDIQNINTKKYQSLFKTLELAGIKFYETKEDIKNRTDHYRKLEYLEWTIEQDIPIANGIKHTRVNFNRYLNEKIFFEKKCYGTEIIAIKNEQYIGTTNLSVFPRSDPFKAWTEGLGVLKEFRRRSIGTALKIKAIKVLINKGIRVVRTDNELNNPMYKINEKLGFYPIPNSLEYLKVID